VKWLLAIPHHIVLAFLGLAMLISVVIAWFAMLFTGHDPRALFDFVIGVGRWALRVAAYAFLLATDRYPPFSLSPDSSAASSRGARPPALTRRARRRESPRPPGDAVAAQAAAGAARCDGGVDAPAEFQGRRA
jgi:hypothetical protein